jgi:long-chain acyl-CoA synthetase
LGWREGPTDEYQWLNYQESLLRAQNFGSGLVALGLRPGPETLVGIYCQNCPEWVLSEYGLYSFSMVIVPLYDTLGPDACRYIINQSKNSCFLIPVCWFCLLTFFVLLTAEMSLVICDNEEKCKLLLNKPPDCLKQLVHIKPISKETVELAKRKNINILSFECVQRIGAERKHTPMVILENL